MPYSFKVATPFVLNKQKNNNYECT